MAKQIHIKIFIQINISIFKQTSKTLIISIDLASQIEMKKLNSVKIIKYTNAFNNRIKFKIKQDKKVY